MNFYEQLFCRGKTTGEGMTHFERLFAAKFGGSPPPEVREYTGAVPVTITADGSPLLDYLITGNTTQSGTPTPGNPIMPQGTGERTGNLFDGEYPDIDGTVRYRALNLGNGTYTLSSTVEVSQGSAGTLFLLAGNVSSGASTTTNAVYKNHPITTTAVDGYVTVAYRTYTVDTPVGKHSMLNTGSTALPYEPYGVKIPISSANTTTPVYLGEVESTRRIKKLVFDGTENWVIISGKLCVLRPTNCIQYSMSISTHFIQTQSANNPGEMHVGGSYINFNYDGVNDNVPAFKSYLAQQYANGTPVTVWYVLATPQTAVVNEPLMKIGDYADTLSKAQAGVQIPTNNGSTTVDVDTTVKPSEVYIKYMG